MKNIFLTIWLLLYCIALKAQDEKQTSPFSISGYVEAYYVYDFNKPENNTRPAFIYSYNRHNEVNLNLGFLKGSYNTENVRANLAIMAGTYTNANLASEPGVLKNIFEANAGVKISSSKNLWVDAGVFASHIGFESAIGKDSWNLTRSILADNTPYFESGAKISYTNENEKWFLSAMILNGWQRIQRLNGNSLPSFGTQVTFKPNSEVTLNSSSFIGTDTPDSARLMRYFHNFYGIIQLSDQLGLTLGFDYGIQQKTSGTGTYDHWLSPVIIARITFSEKISMDVRAEYYEDRSAVIIRMPTPNGFRTTGLSTNLDYKISSNALWRFEIRNFSSRDAIFVREGKNVKDNTFITTSLAINF